MTHTVSTLNIGRIKRIKQLRYQVHINLSLWAHSVTTLYKKFPLLGWIPFKTTKHFRSSDQHNNYEN
jgi:hypothetical protein